ESLPLRSGQSGQIFMIVESFRRSNGELSTINSECAQSGSGAGEATTPNTPDPIAQSRTPRSPAAAGVAVLRGEGVQVDADHWLAESAGDLGHHVGVVEERGCL